MPGVLLGERARAEGGIVCSPTMLLLCTALEPSMKFFTVVAAVAYASAVRLVVHFVASSQSTSTWSGALWQSGPCVTSREICRPCASSLRRPERFRKLFFGTQRMQRVRLYMRCDRLPSPKRCQNRVEIFIPLSPRTWTIQLSPATVEWSMQYGMIGQQAFFFFSLFVMCQIESEETSRSAS